MTDAQVTTIDSGPRKVSRRVTVSAPVADLFALVADPHRHAELDGSGTIRDTPVTGPERLRTGAKFSVGMTMHGVPYKITSKVTEFAEDEVVEWRHPLGHRWRWEFEKLAADRTQVTETFDYSRTKAARLLELLRFPKDNAAGIETTLRGLAERYA